MTTSKLTEDTPREVDQTGSEVDQRGPLDLSRWVVALAMGRLFIGKYTSGPSNGPSPGIGGDPPGLIVGDVVIPTLDPVFEVTTVQVQIPVQGPDGRPRMSLQPQRVIHPIGHLASWTSLVLPHDAAIKHFEDLPEDRMWLEGQVKALLEARAEKEKATREDRMASEATEALKRGFGGGAR